MTYPLLAAPLGLREADFADSTEQARLDAYVRDHRDATPFHLSAWNLAVAKGCGQRPYCLVAERADGSIAGLLPLTEVRSPLFGRALVSSGFGVGGGILAEDHHAITALADAGWALATRLRCPTMELRGGPIPGSDWIIDSTTYLGFARNLAPDDDSELAAIPRKQRAEVRKSLAIDLEVTHGREQRDLELHYRVYAESVRNLGTPVFPRHLFAAVLHHFGESADILTVSHQGKAVSSVLSLYMNGTVYPYWGGGIEAARSLRANDRMYLALMSHARARGERRFDFGRSKAGTGPAAFKKNWGFEGLPLSYAKRAAEGHPPREINPMSPKFRLQVAAWRKLPLGMANILGPLISRGLG